MDGNSAAWDVISGPSPLRVDHGCVSATWDSRDRGRNWFPLLRGGARKALINAPRKQQSPTAQPRAVELALFGRRLANIQSGNDHGRQRLAAALRDRKSTRLNSTH